MAQEPEMGKVMCQIRGLIETKERRGLRGEARQEWLIEAVTALLKAELARLDDCNEVGVNPATVEAVLLDFSGTSPETLGVKDENMKTVSEAFLSRRLQRKEEQK